MILIIEEVDNDLISTSAASKLLSSMSKLTELQLYVYDQGASASISLVLEQLPVLEHLRYTPNTVMPI